MNGIITIRIDYGETDALYFFHTDHLGSTSLLSDENGDAQRQETFSNFIA
ncbi:MAG: hypothetical protein JXA42_08270 [Anaerolineales bacterium]|nr:hypothetical protein [Anaerolineales bacterium]